MGEDLKTFCQSLVYKVIEQVEMDMQFVANSHHPEPNLSAKPLRLLSPLLEKEKLLFDTMKKYPQIHQVKVMQQQDPVSCGYYCFHNAYLMLKAARTNRTEMIPWLFRHLTSPVCYWQRNLMLKRFLTEKCQHFSEDTYPWNKETVQSGVMERPFLRYVLHSWGEAKELLTVETKSEENLRASYSRNSEDEHNCLITLPDFCRSSFRNNAFDVSQVFYLRDVFRRCRESQDFICAFFIGPLNHWALVIVNKVQGDTELLFLDSRGESLLNLSRDQIKKIPTYYYDEREKRTGKKVTYRDWREKTFFDSMCDCVWACKLIYKNVTQDIDFVTYSATRALRGIVESFESHVAPLTSEEDLSEELVLQWTSNYFPIKMIQNSFVKKLPQYGKLAGLPTALIASLKTWAARLHKQFSEHAQLAPLAQVVGELHVLATTYPVSGENQN